MTTPDLRAEAELTWRWQHADHEAASCIRSVWRDALYIGTLTHPGDLRCGPIYVHPPHPPYREPAVEPDKRTLAALRRAAKIDAALRRLPHSRLERLRWAFGAPPGVMRVGRWPVPLVALAPASKALWRASGSLRSVDSWLARVAAHPGTSLALDLELAAGDLVASDCRAYCDARWWS